MNAIDTEATTGRQRILDEAARLFVERGFASTSLRDIASACDMKAGSLYYHFESKNHLLIAVLRRGIEVMTVAFDEASDRTKGADGHTRLRAHIRAHLSALFENGPYTAVHVTSFRTADAAVRDVIIAERDDYEAKWSLLFDDLVMRGDMSADVPTGLARLTLFGAMNTSVEWFDMGRGNLDELANVIADQYWHGIQS